MMVIFFTNISCNKELPAKPDNYDELFNSGSHNSISITIPCDSNLQDNNYKLDTYIGAYNSFNVYQTDGYDHFDTYEVIARHSASTVTLNFELTDKPNSYRGRRVYNISPQNYAGNNAVKVLLNKGYSFSYKPFEDDVIYVDFTDSTMVFSLCEIKLSSNGTSHITLSGRIIHEL
jgi:hypothetical protein